MVIARNAHFLNAKLVPKQEFEKKYQTLFYNFHLLTEFFTE